LIKVIGVKVQEKLQEENVSSSAESESDGKTNFGNVAEKQT